MCATLEKLERLENQQIKTRSSHNVQPIRNLDDTEAQEIAQVRAIDRQENQSGGDQDRIQQYFVGEKIAAEHGTTFRSSLQNVKELAEYNGGVAQGGGLKIIQAMHAVYGQGDACPLHV